MEPINLDTDLGALCRVGEWPSLAEAYEHALVILAMGMDCSVHAVDHGFEILTAAKDAPAAKHELDLYASEQFHPAPALTEEAPDHPAGIAWIAGWAAVLAVVFRFQSEDPGFTDRFANSSRALMDGGEWWRPFTSLFLHADALHLLGNLLIGGMFCLLVSKRIGAWRGWSLILLGGTFGNAVNATIHQREFFSAIGASTATFAALGILVGLAVVEAARSGTYERIRALLIPLVAGLVLFGMFGTSGERTDIAGHGWGSLCGLLLGIAAGWFHWGGKMTEPGSSVHLAIAGSPGRTEDPRSNFLA